MRLEEILSRYQFKEAVVQLGTFCNLDCRYCYIPKISRDAKSFISSGLLDTLAQNLAALPLEQGRPLSILFHAGEPLAVGMPLFREMAEPFEALWRAEKVSYAVQTNATLIDRPWCDLLQELNVGVGVSVDGPEDVCKDRVTRSGRPAFPRIMEGIQHLQTAGKKFGCISVLTADLFQNGADIADLAHRIHNFFSSLRPTSVGFNFEERENANVGRALPMKRPVFEFWRHLYDIWRHDRTYEVRDLRLAERFAQFVKARASAPFKLSLIPTVDAKGNVYFFSPEIVGTKAAQYDDFIVGNLKTESLGDMIARIEEVPYVRDFIAGAHLCREACPVFDICQSTHVLSNKFAEHGDLRSTETSYCRNTYISPAQAVVSAWAEARSRQKSA